METILAENEGGNGVVVFKATDSLTFSSGDLFLGRDGKGQEIGVHTDRHALTIAGSGSGKGTSVIIPNLKRWPHNALVIDPKGENAEKTWQDRKAKGQAVHVIDPFETDNVPAELRASFNPLEYIDKDSLTAGSDLLVVADGLIKRSNPQHAEWDETAMKILAGVMGYAIADAPPEHRTINAARNILMQTPEALHDDALRMMEIDEFDGLIRDAGNTILTGLENDRSLEAQAISQAKRQTQWVGMRPFRNVLESSSFKLSGLKTGKATVFLVLPSEYLDAHGAFLKLFVQTAISAMMKGGANSSTRCLFILDEFFSLGRMDTIQKGFGLLRGYGVQLWPFLQDLGQLITIYGTEGTETFFGNSDVHQFFGTTDDLTLNHVAMRLGKVEAGDIALPRAPSAPIMTGASVGRGLAGMGSYTNDKYTRGALGVMGGLLSAGEGAVAGARQAAYQNEVAQYQHDMQQAMSQVGQLRMPPERVGKLIQRPTGGGIAQAMICFVAGHGPVALALSPYFVKNEPAQQRQTRSAPKTHRKRSISIKTLGWKDWVSIYIACGFLYEMANGIMWRHVFPALKIWDFGKLTQIARYAVNPFTTPTNHFLSLCLSIFFIFAIFYLIRKGMLYNWHWKSWISVIGGFLLVRTLAGMASNYFGLGNAVAYRTALSSFEDTLDLLWWPMRLAQYLSM